MSTYYTVYAEVKIKDKWYNLNPYIKCTDGSFKMQSIMWAQSAFFDTYVELEECASYRGLPNDMSEDMKVLFHENLDDIYDSWTKDYTWKKHYQQSLFLVDFEKAVADKVKRNRPYKYEGYVSKYLIACYESGETDDITSWYTQQEYKDMPVEEQKEYAFYEWNNWGEEYGFYQTITTRVNALLYWLIEESKAFDDSVTYAERYFSPAQVRLYIYRD